MEPQSRDDQPADQPDAGDRDTEGRDDQGRDDQGRGVAVPAEASPGSPAHEPTGTTAVEGAEPEDAWRQGIHLASGADADSDGSGQARSGYWDDEDDPEGPDET